jgi:hypothetical protein
MQLTHCGVALVALCSSSGQGLLRQYVQVLLKDEKKVTADALGKAGLLRRAQRFRAHASFLTASAYKLRKKFFLTQAFEEPAPKLDADGKEEAPPTPPQDPMAAMGMMKQNMMTMVPNMLMMGWVSYFFSGFVLVRLPFPLTDRFKSMLQRGIFLSSLNVSYVSSLSWFFINLFGLRGLFSLVLGSDNGAVDNPDAMMAAQMSMGTGGMMGGPAAPDMGKVYQQEKNEVEIMPYQHIVAQAESRVCKLPILA